MHCWAFLLTSLFPPRALLRLPSSRRLLVPERYRPSHPAACLRPGTRIPAACKALNAYLRSRSITNSS
jgi:hypothetical protein